MSRLETAWRAIVSGSPPVPGAAPARAALFALTPLWRAGVALDQWRFRSGLMPTVTLPRPVISVGNITVGGTGKTTTVRWLVRRLAERGLRPGVLSYGYRADAGKAGAPWVVAGGPGAVPASASSCGDEPAMLARSLPGVPILAGRRRAAAGQELCRSFLVDVVVLDDGFQYLRLNRTVDLVLIDAVEPFGFGHVLPAGTLREPLAALRRADAMVLTHSDSLTDEKRRALVERLRALAPARSNVPIACARHRAVAWRDLTTGRRSPIHPIPEGSWTSFCSLGRPEAFQHTLSALGVRVGHRIEFPDHHPYQTADLNKLQTLAAAAGNVGLITTEKDAVKLPGAGLGVACLVLEVDLEFLEGEEELLEAVVRKISAAGASG